jgi:hypothetical protein
MYKFIIAVFLPFIFICCGTNPKNNVANLSTTTTDSGSVKPNNNGNPTVSNTKLDSNAIVSFFSKGSGIDLSAKEKTDVFLANFNKTNKTNLAAVERRWGREGEVDYCINYSILGKELSQKFRSELSALLSKKQVNLYFDTVCTRPQ